MIITRTHEYPTAIITTGEFIQELIGIKAGAVQSHSLASITIQPGKSSQPHFHKISDESYLILSGTATMIVDTEQFELNPWEAILIQPGEVHQILNKGTEDLVFLAVCVPAWQPDDSYESTITDHI